MMAKTHRRFFEEHNLCQKHKVNNTNSLAWRNIKGLDFMNGMAKSKSCRTLLLAKQIAHSLFQNRFSCLALDLAHTCAVFQKCFLCWEKCVKELIAYNAGMKSVRRPGFLTAEQMGQQSFFHSVNNLFPTLAFIILMIILTVLMIIPTIILNFDLVRHLCSCQGRC